MQESTSGCSKWAAALLLASLVLGVVAVLSPAASSATALGAPVGRSCPEKGVVETMASSSHSGDIEISDGQTMVIQNAYVNEIGNLIVDGGTLIVRDSTIAGHAASGPTNWILENGGCIEFTNSKDWVLDDLWVGGRNYTTANDNSTLLVTNSVMAISAFITGSNTTVNVDNSVWEGFIKFTVWGPLNHAEVFISNSVVRNLGLAFGGGIAVFPGRPWPPRGTIDGLAPGYISHWELNGDQPGFAVPYDMTLTNVTLLSNPVGPEKAAMTEGLGWSIMVTTAGCCSPPVWPSLNISDSRLTALELSVYYNLTRSLTFENIPSASPVNATLFGTVNLTNTAVDAYLSVSYGGTGDLNFVNSSAVGLWASGRVNATFVNSRTNDLNPWGCVCTFTFTNSSWGMPTPTDVAGIPHLDKFPNATNFWAGATLYGFLMNARVRIEGNLTSYPWQCPGICGWQVINTTVTRLYPVVVTYDGKPAAGAKVSLSTGGNAVWQGLTDSSGTAEVPVTYGSSNATAGATIDASFNGSTGRQSVGFTTVTPLVVSLTAGQGGPGGVAEFPYQPTAAAAFVAMLVTVYLVVRGRREGNEQVST